MGATKQKQIKNTRIQNLIKHIEIGTVKQEKHTNTTWNKAHRDGSNWKIDIQTQKYIIKNNIEMGTVKT